MARITGLARLGVVALLAALPSAGLLPAAQAQVDSAAEQTKEITNYGKGTKQNATVRVSTTADLIDRQQVTVDLAGFEPSWNVFSTETYGDGRQVEYPVVVMQCRGDDPDRAACLNPSRSQWQGGFDTNAPAEQRAVAEKQKFAGDYISYPGASYYEQQKNRMSAEQLPFVHANGISYLWDGLTDNVDGAPYIDDPALKSFAPTDVTSAATINTRNVPVRQDGTNRFLFEVRQDASQPSLACTDTQRCSIVVVPIMDMACIKELPGAKPLPSAAAGCGKAPNGPGPEAPSGSKEPNLFVTGQQWLAESNWRNKFVVPISFAPDLETCDLRDNRPVIPTFGSELVAVAQERWAAAYCTGVRQSDYLPGFSVGSEYFARRQLTTKLGANYLQDAAFVTQPVVESTRTVAYAPSALTGFAVAFVVDDGNGRQTQEMTLSPRLLAKLLTQSYNPLVVPESIRANRRPYDGTQQITAENANNYYVAHPALVSNPRSLFADPEFVDLNPDLVLDKGTQGLAPHLSSTLNAMVFTIESDVVMDLTRYITSDPAARAWLDGQPDPYGMRVNPAWLGMEPRQAYTLADSWVRPANPRADGWMETDGPGNKRIAVYGGGDSCDEMLRTQLLTKRANIASSAQVTALALLDRRGSETPGCTATETVIPKEQQAPEPQFPGDDVTKSIRWNETKNVVADFGKRAQLAVTTLSQARLYELPTAKLVNAGGKAVAPTPGTMVNALNAATQDPTTGTVLVDHTKVTGDDWYPGTMASFMAVPTSGLDLQLAARYADYIEFMVTTGQVPGTTLANLPAGYDPLPPAMVQYAKDVAAEVRAQRGEVPTPPAGGPLGNGPAPTTTPPVADNPGSGLPVNPQAATNAKVDADPENVAKTEGASSWLARWALPLLIALGLLAALAAFAVQVSSQPDHPVRRWLDALRQATDRR